MPLEPKLYLPGLALMSLIRSRAVAAGESLPTTSTLGALATCETGAKSLNAS